MSISSSNYLFINPMCKIHSSIINPSIPLSFHPSNYHSSIYSFIHPSIHSFIHPSIHLSIHPSVLPFLHSFFLPSNQPSLNFNS